MFLLLLLLFGVECWEVVPHIPGGLGVRDAHPSHNTVILTLTRGPGARAINTFRKGAIVAPLEAALSQDGCELSFSGLAQGEADMVLTLYCAGLNNSARQPIAERAPLPALTQTLLFLKAEYAYEVKRLEYLGLMRRPAYWYGNYETLDTVLHKYFDEKEPTMKERAYKGKFVEMPAPWGLDRIDMHQGLLDNEYIYNTMATPVDIYIMDTGIRTTHHEFGGRAHFLANTVSDGINTDCAGHGTLVASIAAGSTYGVAKGATLWAVKVLDCEGNGDTFTIVMGAIAVVEHARVRRTMGHRAVASLSLGGGASSAIDDAMLSLLANEISVVVAAGNEYADACSYSPSRLGGNSLVITVGASTIHDTRPAFSNSGRCVTISAPGVGIDGAYYTSDVARITETGTSMATPFVSGVAALVLSQNMNQTVAQVKGQINAWATPNIIAGASVAGGGKNLLYSLIVVASPSPSPPTSPGTPTRPPTGRPSAPTSRRRPGHPRDDELVTSASPPPPHITLVWLLSLVLFTALLA
jgi:subtilisin family serine protease